MKALKRPLSIGLFSLVVLLTTSCHTQQMVNEVNDGIHDTYQQGIRNDLAITEEHGNIPPAINTALLPKVRLVMPEEDIGSGEQTFDITVKDVPAQSFFMGLVKGTDKSMIVSPSLGGNITLNLKGVTIEQTLDAVEEVYGYTYMKTSYGYEVLPSNIQTRMFTLNYLNISRNGASSTSISAGQITENHTAGSTDTIDDTTTTTATTSNGTIANTSLSSGQSSRVSTSSSTDFWGTLQETIVSIIGGASDGRSVIVNSQTGIVVVRAYPKELDKVAEFLDAAEHSLTRQVILEAKIVEVELNNQTQTGINWRALTAELGNNTFDLPDLPPFNQMFSVSVSGDKVGGFEAVLNILETQGTVHVLSSPRIATLNNQKAIIKIGDDQYFVTNVDNTSTGTGTDTTTTSGVDLEPFFSGIALDVKPQIAANGTITLYIHPIISEVTSSEVEVDLGGDQNLKLPLAKSKIRETDSIVSAKNRQIIILGGLMESDVRKTSAKTPGLSNIPIIGQAFTQKLDKIVKSELVILLKPTLIENKSWARQLKESQENMSQVLKSIALVDAPPKLKKNKHRASH